MYIEKSPWIQVNPSPKNQWLTGSVDIEPYINGIFTDQFKCYASQPWTYVDYPDNPLGQGNQKYWAGTEANDGSSGIVMQYYLNRFWTDTVTRNGT